MLGQVGQHRFYGKDDRMLITAAKMEFNDFSIMPFDLCCHDLPG